MRMNILRLVSIVSICFCADAIATDISYPDFSNLAGLVLNGSAAQQSGTNLRLTPELTSQDASAWYGQPVKVTHGFSTSFTFTFTAGDGQTPADGLAFVLHNDPNGTAALGSAGGGLGAEELNNAVAVSFRSYPDARVRLNICSPLAIAYGTCAVAEAAPQNIMGSHSADILYSAGILYVSMDGTLLFSHAVDLTGPLALGPKGTAYVGFTAATGSLAQNNDVTSWSFTNAVPASPGSGGGTLDVITIVLLGVWFAFNVLNGKIETSSEMSDHARTHP